MELSSTSSAFLAPTEKTNTFVSLKMSPNVQFCFYCGDKEECIFHGGVAVWSGINLMTFRR